MGVCVCLGGGGCLFEGGCYTVNQAFTILSYVTLYE